MATVEKLDARAAVAAAKEFAAKLFASEKISELGLEEIELSEDRTWWLVTLGFTRRWAKEPKPTRGGISFFAERQGQREYKVFKIHARTGEVTGVKMHHRAA